MRRRSIESLERFELVFVWSFEQLCTCEHFDAACPTRSRTTRKLDGSATRIAHVDQAIRWFGFSRQDLTPSCIFEVDPHSMSHATALELEAIGS